MKLASLAIVLGLVILSGCTFPFFSSTQKVIEHDAPDLVVDNSYFTSLGCYNDPACLPEALQNIEHPVDSFLEPGNLLGGLDPALPLAVASTRGFTPEDEIPSVYVKRCMTQQYIRYLIHQDNEILLVDSVEALASIYAPIDSQEEALSFAIAATGLSAVYDLDETRKLKLYSGSLEETFVKETEDGFVIHMFDSYLCGCGPHIVRSVDVTVGSDGRITFSEPVEAFSDPELDGLCID